MNLIKLSWSNLRAKPLPSVMSIVLFALGVSLISLLLLLKKQFTDKMENNIEDIHLVVAAKGSKLQMLLCNVYHVDIPTGNIPLSDAFVVTKNPYVEKAIPLALGDSYKAFRIVGTDQQYPAHYKLKVAEGKLFTNDLEVTVGSAVAKKLNLKIGDTFYGAHGIETGPNSHQHEHYAYEVVGIFENSNTVVDKLILTNVASVWRMHEEHEEEPPPSSKLQSEVADEHAAHEEGEHKHATPAQEAAGQSSERQAHGGAAQATEAHTHSEGEQAHHDHEGKAGAQAEHAHDDHDHDHDHAHHGHNHDKPTLAPISREGKEVTAYLVTYKRTKEGKVSAMASQMVPQIIDDNVETMGYARPAIQLQRLLSMLGVGIDALYTLALIFIFISAFSVFISLYNSLRERRYELAQMRVMGASRSSLLLLIVLEGLWIALIGFILGITVSHVGMQILGAALESTYQYPFSGFFFLTEELWLFLSAIGIGVLAALIPALQAYNTSISDTLRQK